jgi:glutathione peroxidase
MKQLSLLISFLLINIFVFAQKPNVYGFKVAGIDSGTTIDLSQFKGKKILIVNVASKCGYTPQYADLEKLYEKYKGQLVIIGFPENNFLGQEPGTNAEIKKFCTGKYNVTFPMAAKINVKGDSICPIYQWLTEKSKNGVEDSHVTWNFNKYLINENGEYVAHFVSKVTPMDSTLISAIEAK